MHSNAPRAALQIPCQSQAWDRRAHGIELLPSKSKEQKRAHMSVARADVGWGEVGVSHGCLEALLSPFSPASSVTLRCADKAVRCVMSQRPRRHHSRTSIFLFGDPLGCGCVSQASAIPRHMTAFFPASERIQSIHCITIIKPMAEEVHR